MPHSEDGKNQTKRLFLKETVSVMLQEEIKNMVPTNNEGVEALFQVISMCLEPTGLEDPHSMLAKWSDELVFQVASKSENISKLIRSHNTSTPPNEALTAKAMERMCRFALIEWCGRNDYLNGDWAWKWDGPLAGHIHFNSKPKVSPDEAYQLLLKSQPSSDKIP